MSAPRIQSGDPVVRANGLRKLYGDRTKGASAAPFVAVDDVSFDVWAGHALGIVGESGSGKTTIARMLVGLEEPTAGRIEIGGKDRSHTARGARGRRERGNDIQIVFQDPYTSLDPCQTVGQAIAEVLRLHFSLTRRDAAAEATTLINLVGLDQRHAHAKPHSLSGGQRQRVAIARALAVRPRVLVLDESVSALDMSIQAQILNLLADIRASSAISYVLISHNLAVVRNLTDDVLVLRDGRVVERGPTSEVLDHPQHPYTRVLRESVPGRGWTPTRRHQRSSHDS